MRSSVETSARRLLAGLLALVVLLAGCSGGTDGGGNGGGGGGGGGGEPTAFDREMLDAVNRERSTAGVSALTWSAKLTQAARRHSADMDARHFMDHTGSDGSSPWDRIRDAGYSYSTAGENVASGFTSIPAVMDAWMHSTGHRANILNNGFTELGAARVGNSWTQDFARPAAGGKPTGDEVAPPLGSG